MSLLIILIAVYGLVTSTNLVRKMMCLAVIESMVIFQFLAAGAGGGGAGNGQSSIAAGALQLAPPILGTMLPEFADPLPQALMLTAIVIGVCFNSLAVALIVKLHQRRGTVDVRKLHEL